MIKKIGIQNREEEEALPIFLTCYIDDCVYTQFKREPEELSISADDMTETIKKFFSDFKKTRDDLISELYESVQDNIIINSDMEYDDEKEDYIYQSDVWSFSIFKSKSIYINSGTVSFLFP